jgi:P-type Cu2+ transporter
VSRPETSCFHCGGEVPPGTRIEEVGDAGILEFCCRGCHGAYLLISGAGLDDFYRRRSWAETGVAADAYQLDFQDSYLSRFVHPLNDSKVIDIIIDGIRCASCVWLNERMMKRLAGVREVRINYATGRARVVFDEEMLGPAAIFSRIAELGYLPRPYTESAARESARREHKDLLVRFGTAFFLTMQLMAYSFALYAGYFEGIEAGSKGYLQLFSLLVTTPVVFYCGWPFLAGARRGLGNRFPNMELLIAVGALSSYGYSIYGMATGGEVYFETAAMIVTLILGGRLLENAAKRRAAGGVERLLRICSGEAHRFRGDELETVEASELRDGDLILVSPGERFPVDGTVMAGSSDVDESPATGEAMPVGKAPGEQVIAGSSNLTGALRVRCDRAAAESFLARVARLVEEAQCRRAPIQGVADRAAAFFVPTVLCLAIVTFWLGYVGGGSFGSSLMTALSVVVIACPCALGLATPTAILAGTGAAASRGVIFKGGDILEHLSRVSAAVFDKTGTLTWGRPEIVRIGLAQGEDRGEVLALAAAIESGSSHPIARAIVAHAAANGIAFQLAEGIRTVAGGGVCGVVSGEQVALGSRRFLNELGVTGLPGAVAAPSGGTIVFLARAGSCRAVLVLKDRLREDAPDLVSYFKGAGVRTFLLSGDRREAAEEAAELVGIETGMGALSPSEKVSYVDGLRADGATVLMVGDGINDAPALAAADVGCAVAGGTDIAVDTSDLVLVKPDLERLATAHFIARRTMTVVRQNLFWAFLYNAVGIPLAMTGRLTPVYAAGAMALSSVCVVGNSLRLLGGRWMTRSLH